MPQSPQSSGGGDGDEGKVYVRLRQWTRRTLSATALHWCRGRGSASKHRTVGSKNALGFSAYTGPKIIIGLRPWYKFDKRSDTGSNISKILYRSYWSVYHRYESHRSFL